MYVIVRVLVAAYIFMTGYGHFCYFYNRTSSSWLRLAQVLFRVNIYTMFLCIVMNRTYLFYYFVPLTTFWFLMVRLSTLSFCSLVSLVAVLPRFCRFLSRPPSRPDAVLL